MKNKLEIRLNNKKRETKSEERIKHYYKIRKLKGFERK